jgi:hypothetical protein
MSDRQRKPRVEHLAIPIETMGWYVDVFGVSLSRGSESGTYRIGLFLQPGGAPPESALHLFVTVSDAAFLRDSLIEVLKDYRVRQTGAN